MELLLWLTNAVITVVVGIIFIVGVVVVGLILFFVLLTLRVGRLAEHLMFDLPFMKWMTIEDLLSVLRRA